MARFNRPAARAVLWAAGLAILLILAGCADQVETDIVVQPDGAWAGEARFSFDRPVDPSPGWTEWLDARVRERAAELLEGREIAYAVARTEGQDGTVLYEFAVQGRELRALAGLVADLRAAAEGLGGPAIVDLIGELEAGQVLEIGLPGNPSTGYGWTADLAAGTARARARQGQIRPLAPGRGALARQIVELTAEESGPARIRLAYRRPWQVSTPPTRRLSIRADGQDLAGLVAALGLPAPAAPTETAPVFASTDEVTGTEAETALPSSFSWCSQGACTPVRDQRSCGSCWAFATVGAMESAILRQGGPSVDLSEQYLISCNFDGWSCGGGWWAHEYHVSKYRPPESTAGAVLESAFPYSGKDASSGTPCGGPYKHPYKLSSWAYVNPGNVNSVPSTSALKQAIYEHGPISAAVCVGSGWGTYGGGVFSTNESSACNGGVNHGIVLVGWNDAEQTWILRNSWGSSWGESGYMRIKWGISNVGFGASYVVYTKPAPPPDYDHRVYLPMLQKARR